MRSRHPAAVALCFAVAFAFFGIAACGDDGGPTDSGPRPDGPTGGPLLPTCAAPLLVEPTDGVTETVSVDTELGPPGPLDLGPDCGSSASPPQVVLEYVVPGVGPRSVEATTATDGTPLTLDTVLAIRRAACDQPEPAFPASCFDDVEVGVDNRSTGYFQANGGDHVWIVVTGYGEDDRGPIQLDLTATPNSPPVLYEGDAQLAEGMLRVHVVGEDTDANASRARVALFDSTRALVDTDGDRISTPDDVLEGPFAKSVGGVVRFDETADLALSASATAMDAVRGRVWVLDDGGGVSDPIEVQVLTGTVVGLGDACDGMTTVCARELTCSAGSCIATPARAAACAVAPTISVPTPVSSTTTAMASGVVMGETGLFSGTCGVTRGGEVFFRVTVPVGPPTVDLILTTDSPGTEAGSDTVVYARTDCVDPGSSMPMWCNDDEASGMLLSRVEILDAPPATYTVFVEDYRTSATSMLRFELVASLRPVLAAGSSCDPAGVLNRCASGPCPSGTSICG